MLRRIRKFIHRVLHVMAAANCWQIEELHTEEGRLDEVFRSITLPDTEEGRRSATIPTNKEVSK